MAIPIFTTIATILASGCLYVCYATYRHRSKINELRKAGVPMPEDWSWIFGHLHVLQRYRNPYPMAASAGIYATVDQSREYLDQGMFLMDMWPVFPALLNIFTPEAGNEVSTKYSLGKYDVHVKMMLPIAGGPSLLAMNNPEWKFWRTMFNPGFGPSAVTENVPYLVDVAEIFCEKLRDKVGKEAFSLDEFTVRMMMDVILKMALGMKIDYQRSFNIIAHGMLRILAWHSFWDPMVLFNPMRIIVQTYYGYVINRAIRKELERQFEECKRDPSQTQGIRTVTSMAMKNYMAEISGKEGMLGAKLDPHFADIATYQVRLFLFAGNDTTSASLVWTYHLLHKHPEVLRKLREEHDRVLGTDVSQTATILRQQPAILNQCPYTFGVIKESLRLYPPAMGIRKGRPGVVLTDLQGTKIPMEHIGAGINHAAMHLNPRVWPRVMEFIPERWMVEPGHELYPQTGAWRPFELGSRKCIGPNVAYTQMKIILAMTARTFEIRPAYEEWDAIKEREANFITRWMKSSRKETLKTVHGDRAYQTDVTGAHASEGYPCVVSLTDRG